ncbi:MAG: putative signal transducing protein [Phycisphaeraceae bacterium]
MHEDDDSVVTLAFFPSEIEATMIADELKREGIQAEPAGLLTAGFRAEAPGRVKVLVHAKDLARAKELLDDYIASRDEIDWSQVDLGEPEDAGE